MYSAGISFNTIVPLSRGSVVTDLNVTMRPLSVPCYYVFFDVQDSPAYEIVFLVQLLCGMVMYTTTVTICGLSAVFVMHACAQMEILMRMMKDLVEENDLERPDLGVKLAVIIERQVKIRK